MKDMFRLLFFFITANFCLFSVGTNIKITAKSAIVIDAKTGQVLYEKNANDRFFPASLTKIATVYYTLETVSELDQLVTPSSEALLEIEPGIKHKKYDFPPYILEKDGTKMYGIRPNTPVRLEDLLYGIMLVSGNNASNTLAEAVSGDILSFVEELNGFLREKGINNTQFKNPHGLHFPGHYSSAYDLAMITKYAMENPIFSKIVRSISYEAKNSNYKIMQSNKLLLKDSNYYYPKATGVKLGYTHKSGYNLVAAAEDENRSLIGVVLGCEKNIGQYKDMIKLFDTFFSEEIVEDIIFSDSQIFEKMIPGAKNPIRAALYENLSISYYLSANPQIEAFVEWTNVQLPIKEGQIVGNLIVKDKGIELARACLYSQNNVNKEFGKWITDLFPKVSK